MCWSIRAGHLRRHSHVGIGSSLSHSPNPASFASAWQSAIALLLLAYRW